MHLLLLVFSSLSKHAAFLTNLRFQTGDINSHLSLAGGIIILNQILNLTNTLFFFLENLRWTETLIDGPWKF